MGDESHSVTVLLDKLKSQSRPEYNEAAQQLWERYVSDLLAKARQRLAPRIRQREDEHDVLQSVYNSFCTRQARGEFRLGSRSDFTYLIHDILRKKAANVAARHTRKRRDVAAEQKAEVRDGDADGDLLRAVASCEPSADDAAEFAEAVRLRLEALSEPCRRVACWKIAGFTDLEIAAPDKENCSVKTVERRVRHIREVLAQKFGDRWDGNQ